MKKQTYIGVVAIMSVLLLVSCAENAKNNGPEKDTQAVSGESASSDTSHDIADGTGSLADPVQTGESDGESEQEGSGSGSDVDETVTESESETETESKTETAAKDPDDGIQLPIRPI